MFTSHLASSVLNGFKPVQAQSVVLTAGQVLQGEVVRVVRGQTAVVQFGSMQLEARLETPLFAGQRSWFQVQNMANPIVLKVLAIPSEGQQTPQNDLTSLSHLFGLKSNRQNEQLLQFFVQEKLPMNRQTLQQTQSALSSLGHSRETFAALQQVITRGWPLTETTIGAVRAFLFDAPLFQQMEQVRPQLSAPQQQALLPFSSSLPLFDESRQSLIREFFQQLGLQNEQHMHRSEHINNLKQHLQQMLIHSNLTTTARQGIESMVQHITGQQLFFNLEGQSSPFYQLLFQLPIQHENRINEFYGHLEGQKDAKGEVDAKNCRIIFYVQLQELGEMCIDVHVYHQNVSITIFNKYPLQSWLKEYKPILGEALNGFGYTLTGLGHKGIEKVKKPFSPNEFPQHHQGVDIRI